MVAIVDDMLFVYKAGHVMVDCVHNCTESCYGSIVSILNSAANIYTVGHKKHTKMCFAITFVNLDGF